MSTSRQIFESASLGTAQLCLRQQDSEDYLMFRSFLMRS